MAAGLGEVLGWFTGVLGITGTVFMVGRSSARQKQEALCQAQIEKCNQRFNRGNERFTKEERAVESMMKKLAFVQFLLMEITSKEQQKNAAERMDNFNQEPQ